MTEYMRYIQSWGPGNWEWLVILVVVGFIIAPAWKICSRVGRSGWASLLILIPGFGIILFLWWLALSKWPVIEQKEVIL